MNSNPTQRQHHGRQEPRHLYVFNVRTFFRVASIALFFFYLGTLVQMAVQHHTHTGCNNLPNPYAALPLSYSYTSTASEKQAASVPAGIQETPFSYEFHNLKRDLLVQRLDLRDLMLLHATDDRSHALLIVPGAVSQNQDPFDRCEIVKVWFTSYEYQQDPNHQIKLRKETLETHFETSAKKIVLPTYSCAALLAQPVHDTNQVFQWRKQENEEKNLHKGRCCHSFLENEHVRDELRHYVSNFQLRLKEISTILDSFTPRAKEMEYTVALVVTGSRYSDWPLIQNILCTSSSAPERGFNLPAHLVLIVVCLDSECYRFLQEQQLSTSRISSFYNADLVSPAIVLDDEQWVLAQTYATQMILHLGFNLVSLSPGALIYRSDNKWLDHFHVVDNSMKNADRDKDDIYFAQGESLHSSLNAKVTGPWRVDSQILHIRSNLRTKYLWSQVVMSVDQFLLGTDSLVGYSATLSQLIWEQVSLFGLRAHIVTSPASENVPNNMKNDIDHTVQVLKALNR